MEAIGASAPIFARAGAVEMKGTDSEHHESALISKPTEEREMIIKPFKRLSEYEKSLNLVVCRQHLVALYTRDDSEGIWKKQGGPKATFIYRVNALSSEHGSEMTRFEDKDYLLFLCTDKSVVDVDLVKSDRLKITMDGSNEMHFEVLLRSTIRSSKFYNILFPEKRANELPPPLPTLITWEEPSGPMTPLTLHSVSFVDAACCKETWSWIHRGFSPWKSYNRMVSRRERQRQRLTDASGTAGAGGKNSAGTEEGMDSEDTESEDESDAIDDEDGLPYEITSGNLAEIDQEILRCQRTKRMRQRLLNTLLAQRQKKFWKLGMLAVDAERQGDLPTLRLLYDIFIHIHHPRLAAPVLRLDQWYEENMAFKEFIALPRKQMPSPYWLHGTGPATAFREHHPRHHGAGSDDSSSDGDQGVPSRIRRYHRLLFLRETVFARYIDDNTLGTIDKMRLTDAVEIFKTLLDDKRYIMDVLSKISDPMTEAKDMRVLMSILQELLLLTKTATPENRITFICEAKRVGGSLCFFPAFENVLAHRTKFADSVLGLFEVLNILQLCDGLFLSSYILDSATFQEEKLPKMENVDLAVIYKNAIEADDDGTISDSLLEKSGSFTATTVTAMNGGDEMDIKAETARLDGLEAEEVERLKKLRGDREQTVMKLVSTRLHGSLLYLIIQQLLFAPSPDVQIQAFEILKRFIDSESERVASLKKTTDSCDSPLTLLFSRKYLPYLLYYVYQYGDLADLDSLSGDDDGKMVVEGTMASSTCDISTESEIESHANYMLADLLVVLIPSHYPSNLPVLLEGGKQVLKTLIDRLIRDKRRHIVLAGIRLLRVCVTLNDPEGAMANEIIKQDMFQGVFDVLMRLGNRNNLINSSILSLVDLVGQFNRSPGDAPQAVYPQVAKYLVDKYRESVFEKVKYSRVFDNILIALGLMKIPDAIDSIASTSAMTPRNLPTRPGVPSRQPSNINGTLSPGGIVGGEGRGMLNLIASDSYNDMMNDGIPPLKVMDKTIGLAVDEVEEAYFSDHNESTSMAAASDTSLSNTDSPSAVDESSSRTDDFVMADASLDALDVIAAQLAKGDADNEAPGAFFTSKSAKHYPPSKGHLSTKPVKSIGSGGFTKKAPLILTSSTGKVQPKKLVFTSPMTTVTSTATAKPTLINGNLSGGFHKNNSLKRSLASSTDLSSIASSHSAPVDDDSASKPVYSPLFEPVEYSAVSPPHALVESVELAEEAFGGMSMGSPLQAKKRKHDHEGMVSMDDEYASPAKRLKPEEVV